MPAVPGILVFVGAAPEAGFVTGRHQAILMADAQIDRHIANVVKRCEALTALDQYADMRVWVRRVSASLQSGMPPADEFWQRWLGPAGTYWSFFVRAAVPAPALQASIVRTADALGWELSEAARAGIARCAEEMEVQPW